MRKAPAQAGAFVFQRLFLAADSAGCAHKGCAGMIQHANPTPPSAAIELRIEHLAHLFDALDPFPVPKRDLAGATEDFVVGWARELPRSAPLQIVVHVPASVLANPDAAMVQAAFGRHFAERADMASRDLKDLFRTGRLSLLIGIGALAASVAGGQLIAAILGDGYAARFFTEGLFILGWVANWRPLEVFLYDWWPLVRRRALLRRLAAAPVELRSA
jgi:hypothetical protein